MASQSALKVAIELLFVPTGLRFARSTPLPKDVVTLLQIAAGDMETIRVSSAAVERPPQIIEDAASFFIEQILFHSQSDSYRVLGADPDASSEELRRNLGLLLKWVHPDVDRASSRVSFSVRVNQAWDELKTPDRRRAYDAKRMAKQIVVRRAKRRGFGTLTYPEHQIGGIQTDSLNRRRGSTSLLTRARIIQAGRRDGLVARFLACFVFRS